MHCYDGPWNEKKNKCNSLSLMKVKNSRKSWLFDSVYFFVTTICFKYFESTKQQWLTAKTSKDIYKSDGKYCIYIKLHCPMHKDKSLCLKIKMNLLTILTSVLEGKARGQRLVDWQQWLKRRYLWDGETPKLCISVSERLLLKTGIQSWSRPASVITLKSP